MTRSADFDATIKHGKRVVEPDVVVHAGQAMGSADEGGPRIGLIVAKSVGSAVERHRVARRLRHVVRAVLAELEPSQRIVVRALPSSRHAISARLEEELRAGLRRVGEVTERHR